MGIGVVLITTFLVTKNNWIGGIPGIEFIGSTIVLILLHYTT